jgi:lysozyme
MNVSANAVNLMKHYEQGPQGGWARFPYQCPADKTTIGYGHVVLPGESFSYPMSEATALKVLETDINKFAGDVTALLFVEPTQDQFDSMVCLAFNTGVGKADGIGGDFADSALVRYFNESQFQLAAAEFSKWVYSAGRVLNGLVFRRKTEALLFSTGRLQFFN